MSIKDYFVFVKMCHWTGNVDKFSDCGWKEILKIMFTVRYFEPVIPD